MLIGDHNSPTTNDDKYGVSKVWKRPVNKIPKYGSNKYIPKVNDPKKQIVLDSLFHCFLLGITTSKMYLNAINVRIAKT